MMKNLRVGTSIHISGIVQGVGFRPFVYTLAQEYQLTGWVRNTTAGVDIEVNGDTKNINSFIQQLQNHPPPLAYIEEFSNTPKNAEDFKAFEIRQSKNSSGFQPISPDIAICSDCQLELHTPGDPRYRYPFINCTNCGPRFTIIKEIPYDRANTTMRDFDFCPMCKSQYELPTDRRFHAQPVACAVCGPEIWLEGGEQSISNGEAAIVAARVLLSEGGILAIKGLGGFHLACNAYDEQAVAKLRLLKNRPAKPFALMLPDITAVEDHCELDVIACKLLTGPKSPIVIMSRKANSRIASGIAPGQKTLGVILPYTPLHVLLLERSENFPLALVMTSGNISGLPLIKDNDEAIDELRDIADAFLLHNREIEIRCDDSVLYPIKETLLVLRRSRGYAPTPIRTQSPLPPILAAGAELKNTFCLAKGRRAFSSHYIGDLKNYESFDVYQKAIRHYEALFRITPEILAHDLHPDYLSTRYAQKRAQEEGQRLIAVQHHHAHLAACMAENAIQEGTPIIGLAFDGTGYGTDGTAWGGEVLLATYQQFERLYHLAPFPLPGGDLAIKKPWRTGLALLHMANMLDDASQTILNQTQRAILLHQLETRINTPMTSSMGRLFDGFAALAGVRCEISYEGQAAIEFEMLVDRAIEGSYPFTLQKTQILWQPALEALLFDLKYGTPTSTIAARFHNGLAQLALDVCIALKKQTGIHQVALSGGVWQNTTLLIKTYQQLSRYGFDILLHQQLPSNDGGIAFGQAIVAAQQLKN